MKPGARFALALVLAALSVVLLWPPPADARRPSMTALIAPLTPGAEVAAGFRLTPLRRGEEHDVVLVARREHPPARIEVHVLDRGRWPDAAVAGAYGVAYEEPRSTAALEDLVRVRDAVAAAVRSHPEIDARVDELALTGEPSPGVAARTLGRLSGARGVAIAVAVAVAFELVASLPAGTALVCVALALLGASLRFPSLDLPFFHDQDVQRAFTGHLPLTRMLSVEGLDDRHPPLWFVVLHFVETFGQSESVLRAPAAVCGTLLGPAVALTLGRLREPLSPIAAAAALATTASVELVAASREVSEIPLMALLAIAMVSTTAALAVRPSRRATFAAVLAHVAGLYTYYLAPLVLVGEALSLGRRRWPSAVRRAAAWTAALSLPAVVLLARTVLRDTPARVAARLHPETAWGDRSVLATARGALALLVETYPVVLLALVVFAALSPRKLPRAAALGLIVTLASLALAAPFARVQPYYQAAVAPLAAVAAGALFSPHAPRLFAAAIALAVSVPAVLATRGAATLYVPDGRARATALLGVAASGPGRRLVVSVQYDVTLAAYVIARRQGVSIDWSSFVRTSRETRVLDWTLVPLSSSHDPRVDPRDAAAAAFDDAIDGGALFLEREPYADLVRARIASRCEVLDEGPGVRLHACK